jgi:peptidoglycan/xylan/chitin deacetylase (PgdA/CDA1 family)
MRLKRFLLGLSLLGLSILFAIGSPSPAAAAYLRVPVLMYHYISKPPDNADATLRDLAVDPNNFRLQMAYLKAQGYHTITPETLIAALTAGGPLPDKPIMLTFDDGYADAFSNAYPILKENGQTGTFFIITGLMNQSGYLTWDQAKIMLAGGMSFGDHSKTHQNMAGRTDVWLKTEIFDTRDDIRAHLGFTPTVFCYPMGRYDRETVKVVQEAGFKMAFTTRGSSYLNSTQMLALPRVRIHGSTTLFKFIALITIPF